MIYNRREEDITPLLIKEDIFIRSLSAYDSLLTSLEDLQKIFSKEYNNMSFEDIIELLYS